MSGFKYVIDLIEEQMKLIPDEFRFAEGDELKKLQDRYKDCNEAHLTLTGLNEQITSIKQLRQKYRTNNHSIYTRAENGDQFYKHDYVHWLEHRLVNKNELLSDASNRRELLLDFACWLKETKLKMPCVQVSAYMDIKQ